MKILQVIMAHAEAAQTFDRHLPFWETNGDLIVMCPGDSVIRTSHPVICFGRRSHHDWMANQRFKYLLLFLERLSYDQFIINEYDSLCLNKRVPEYSPEFLWSNVWTNTEPHRFHGSHYFHPPLVMGMGVLCRVNAAMKGIPEEAEEGFWDRYIGVAVDRSGVNFQGYGAEGFSRNTIEPHDIPAAVAARKAGASMFHGVKTAEVLRELLNAC